ncbi:hypothetical protein HPP92_016680 [Vanilla planifolia]|uniref:Uncharacterized protein n=1 Tax=Vanilla planifolia TaxID=51239 RepID=A0A835QMV9_VANPL|nr:hypothetical protein HPP92_017322 [Vanilla planifolia]KAG0472134.1 hypothetical protein HPP92_016680 [Vanilla planifolia]
MVMSFTRIYSLLWRSRNREKSKSASSGFVSGFRDNDSSDLLPIDVPKMGSSTRRMKSNWQRKEEMKAKVDREYDMVIVPSDGDCLSGSESDGSDWSIGWSEPYSMEFQRDSNESETSFAVLVPCYGHPPSKKSSKSRTQHDGDTIMPSRIRTDADEYTERWLASLQNM